MKRKLVLFLVLLLLSSSLLTYVFAASLSPVTNLAAKSEIGQVRISWKKTSQAEGYILYRQVGNSGGFSYLYITSNLGFLDKKASTTQWNFYRVYPYKTVHGKKVVGPSDRYVYGKALKATYEGSVTGLKAVSSLGHVALIWNKLSSADGYYIYSSYHGEFGYSQFMFLAQTKNNFYNHFDEHNTGPYLYRVYPYKIIAGKKVAGKSTSYVYGKLISYTASLSKHPIVFRPASLSNGKLFITWDSVPGAKGYRLSSDTEDKIFYTTSTSVIRSDLNPNKLYEYTIRPYILVKGKIVRSSGLGLVSFARPYKEPNHYYSGVYKVGTHIPLSNYYVRLDEVTADDISYVDIKKADGTEKRIYLKRYVDPVAITHLVHGDVIYLVNGVMSRYNSP